MWILKLCFFTFLIYVSLLSASCKQDEGLVIKLHRQKTSFEQHVNNLPNLSKYGKDLNGFYKKYHLQGPRTNDSIALYRYLDNEFYGTIVVGHPGQTLNVAFDTAWSLSWVISSECYFTPTNIGCLFHNKYDHTKSSEYKPDNRPIVIPEDKYNYTGYFSYDNVSVAHSNVTNFNFAEMTKVPYTMLFNKIDGVLGLGLQIDSYEPFFYALFRQKKVLQPIFCLYLNRDKQSKHGGNVILGFIEKRHIHSTKKSNKTVYDTIKFMPVKPGNFWEFDLDSVYVNLQKETLLAFCKSGCTAITDSSSNNIVGPRNDVDAIHKIMKAAPFFLNRYRVDCETINKFPEIGFTIGGQNFTLKGRDYTVKMTYFSITLCLSAFVPQDVDKFWVFGGAFLSEYYTIYNINDKIIGIVKAA